MIPLAIALVLAWIIYGIAWLLDWARRKVWV